MPTSWDSDGDSLVDGDEVAAGTNPCNPDTDGDGVPDDLDPTPTTPGVPGGFLEELLRELQNSTIAALELSVFSGPNASANAGRRNSLMNRAGEAAIAVAQGDYAGALDELNALLEKIDSITPPPDWMVDSAEKWLLADQVRLYISLVQLM
jgi:hypothetical protein